MGSERVAHPWLPPGFRFHPTDEELVTCYLAKKMQDEAFMDPAIAEVDLHKCEPWDLPGMAKIGEREWYFYSFLDRKYPTGLRANRATEAGYWKATGKDKEVVSSRTNRLVGMKKTLVFYKGRAPKGQKTNWVMHEYRLVEPNIFARTSLAKEELVVCRLFQKNMAMVAPSPSSSSSLPPLMDSTQPLFSKPESIMTSTLESHPNIKHLEAIDSSLNCFSPNIVLKSFINHDVKQVDIIGQTRPLHNYGNLLDDIFNNYHFNGGLKQDDIQKSVSTHLVSEEENNNHPIYSNRLLPNNASDLDLCNLWKY